MRDMLCLTALGLVVGTLLALVLDAIVRDQDDVALRYNTGDYSLGTP